MKFLHRYVTLALLLWFVSFPSQATEVYRHDLAQLRNLVEFYLQSQTLAHAGEITVSVGQIDPRLNLANCPSPEPFMPGTSRAWGRTTVGIRCSDPVKWTIYVQAKVSVIAEYLAAALPITAGQVITENQIAKMKGDIAALPSIQTDPTKVIGRIAATSIAAGAPLRTDALRQQQAVQQGQSVKMISMGPGFKISAEGFAVANAGDGQLVQVRTQAGQLISGIARLGGVVEVNY